MAKYNKGSVYEGEFWITNDEGKEVKCEVLFTFESEETHKNYIVYTDNSADVDGSTKVYASTYDPEGSESSLKPIESYKEWKVIETILAEIQDSIKSEEDSVSDASEDSNLIPNKSEGSDCVTEDDISLDDIVADFPFPLFDATLVPTYESLVESIERMMLSSDHKLDKACLKFMANRITVRLVMETEEEHIDYLFKTLDDIGLLECSEYSHIGIESYSNGNFIVAEEAFRRAVAFCQEDVLRVGYANKLAYLIRRKEIRSPEKVSGKEIVELLKPGTAQKDTFSLINMALFWALNIGTEDDWKMADELISLVSKSDVHGAYLWWLDVGNKDDVEGHLVHLLLIRNGKIAKSPLGEMKTLYDKVKSKYVAIPAELQNIVTPFDGGTTDTLPCLDDWL